MAKNEIPKISDFQSLGLCDGFAKVAFSVIVKTSRRFISSSSEQFLHLPHAFLRLTMGNENQISQIIQLKVVLEKVQHCEAALGSDVILNW